MPLMRVLPFWLDIRTGAVGGLAVGVAFTIWRVVREGSAGWTAVGCAAAALAFGGLLSLYLWRWVPKHTRKAEPVPEDAEIMERGKLKWWALVAGFGFGVAAIGRAGDDGVIASGIMTGVVAGAVVGYSVGVARLRRWQAEHGQELLRWRRGRLRNPRHYVRPLERAGSGRFERDRVPATTR